MDSGSPVMRGFGPRIHVFITRTPKGERRAMGFQPVADL